MGLSGKVIFVNHELIRTMESGPETILCFVDGMRLPVCNTAQEILDRIVKYKLSLQPDAALMLKIKSLESTLKG